MRESIVKTDFYYTDAINKINNKKSISAMVIVFSLNIVLMLFQADKYGSIFAAIAIVLTLLSTIISRSVSFSNFYLPQTSKIIIVFCLLLLIVSLAKSGLSYTYFKFMVQVFLFLFLSSVQIDPIENEFLKWIFIASSTFYAILIIIYCFKEGNARYYHSDLILFGAALDPNFIGIPFVASLALLLDKILNSQKRILCILLYFAISFAVILTASRGNMLAWIISNGSVVFIFAKSKRVKGLMKWVKIIFIFGLLSIFVLFVSKYYEMQWVRMSSVLNYNDNARLILWKYSFGLWKKSPIFGNGFGSMFRTFGHAAHNTFLEIITDSGIIGAFLMLLFLISLLFSSYKKDKILFAMLLGIITQSAFLDTLDNRVIWIVFCWIAMLNFKTRNNSYEINNKTNLVI